MVSIDDTSYLGSIVISRAGRDGKREFVIVGLDNNSSESDIVYIADGRLRKIESPKKKKLKHLILTGKVSEKARSLITSGTLTNKCLHSILNEYRQV